MHKGEELAGLQIHSKYTGQLEVLLQAVLNPYLPSHLPDNFPDRLRSR